MQTIDKKVEPPVNLNKKPSRDKIPKSTDPNFNAYIQMIEKRAYELFEKRGCQHGLDCDDWYNASKLIEDELRQSR